MKDTVGIGLAQKAWQLIVVASAAAHLRAQKLRPMTRRRAEEIRSYVPTCPDYDELYIMCRCGNRMGGTILRGKPFELHCLNCERVWTGTIEASGPQITASEIIKRRKYG